MKKNLNPFLKLLFTTVKCLSSKTDALVLTLDITKAQFRELDSYAKDKKKRRSRVCSPKCGPQTRADWQTLTWP